MKDTVLCLCDLTGVFARPWVEEGYTAILIDPQHPEGITVEKIEMGGKYIRVGHEIDHPTSWQVIRENLHRLALVAGFPVCTNVSLSGTRWWAAKAAADRYFQCKATRLAEQCKTIGELSGAPFFFENPASAFSRIFGKPCHKFHPHQYTLLAPQDNYKKDTWLWTGNGFVMPPEQKDRTLGDPDDRIHKCAPGPDRANIRSATPAGFSMGVFKANAKEIWPWPSST